ncbi:hypothetical protein L1887_20792 [Cichorium endivia]|nr:hypothetical protein L1887_20792 [Cichorium endivia]
MAAFSSSSSSYISHIVRIRQENHNALPLRLRLPPSSVGSSMDSGIKRRPTSESQSRTRLGVGVRAAGNLAAGTSNWDAWKPDLGSKAPSLSDIFWPSAGAFAAMAVLGKMDQMLAKKGVSMTIAPLGAVCAVLFATPSTPGARKYNMFMAQMGCAAIGVLAFSFFGPGWLARSTALSASLAFMIYTRAVHPPAASLPLLFIDGAKFHQLKFWYVLFPGAAGCLLLCLIQEVVCYLKDNVKF